MMTKKKLIIIIGLFTAMLICIRLLWIGFNMNHDFPQAKKGTLDLRGMILQEKGTVPLNGEWLFYPGEFIDPKSKKEPIVNRHSSWINVPNDWREMLADQRNSPFGYGTYRLQILLNQQMKQPLSLYFKEIRTASSIYINGEKVYEKGKASQNKKESVPDYSPFKINITDHMKKVDLVIHVSNFESYRSGGITKSIRLGTTTAIEKERIVSFLMQFMVSVVLFLHGVFALIIFALYKRKKEIIYIAITFFCATLSVLVDDDKLLLYIFPSIEFHWWFKLYYFSYVGSVFFLVLFLKKIGAMNLGRKLSTAINLFLVLCTIYILLLFQLNHISEMFLNTLLYALIMYFSVLLTPIILWGVATKRDTGFIYMLLGTISIGLNILWGAVKSRVFEMPYYPFDFILGVIFFAVFWFKRFFQVTKESQEFAAKLKK